MQIFMAGKVPIVLPDGLPPIGCRDLLKIILLALAITGIGVYVLIRIANAITGGT